MNGQAFRIGYGEDTHALAAGRLLIVGGVPIASPHGAVAHSDGDVLLHALADALLAGYALGDIGEYYPPTEASFKDMDSAEIVKGVLAILDQHAAGFSVVNVAAVVTLDQPRLGPYRQRMQARIAELLSLEPERVGATFKTSEGLAPGHIQARVTVLLVS
ncbi:MAG: 2-C-methyl-D-erythritol 2,4-cyclodiphosphate synthase [Truepera sp.]|nr:2-C-methyl-D-erythritol 2,4-cyclodiphosphate synthase [Truepera sp.]